MKKSLIIFISLLLILMPITSAFTEKVIHVKSEPYRNFVVRVMDSSGSITDSVYGKANSSGDADILFNATLQKVKFMIIVRFNGETEKAEETQIFSTSDPIRIELRDNIPIEENLTLAKANDTIEQTNITNQTNQTQEESISEENKKSISGLAISDTVKSNYKKIVYVIIGIIILIIVILAIVKMSKRNKTNNQEDSEDSDDDKDEYAKIQRAESRLEEARKDIEELKRKEIEKEEKRILKEQQKLAKLRGEKKQEPIKQNQEEKTKSNKESFY